MKRVLIVASLMSLGWIGTAGGQTTQAESVLDRIVARQPDGGPFVFTPPINDWSDQAVIGIGRAADIVVGFEAAPEVERMLVSMTVARKAEIDSRHRVSLAGKTVRKALDTIVAVDSRYRWMDVHGVPVVRPAAAWVDSKHLLNQIVAGVEWPGTNLAKALFDVEKVMTGTVPLRPMTADQPPFFSVRTGPVTALELLNAVALAHGHAAWQVRHGCSPNDPRAIEIQTLSYRHDEIAGGVGCMHVARD
jgi:hypothetical protein